MRKINATINVFVDGGKTSWDPAAYNWVLFMENWPVWIDQDRNEMEFKRPDGSEFIYEYRAHAPMSDDDITTAMLLPRSTKFLIQVDLGVFGQVNWISVDLRFVGTQVTFLANRVNDQIAP